MGPMYWEVIDYSDLAQNGNREGVGWGGHKNVFSEFVYSENILVLPCSTYTFKEYRQYKLFLKGKIRHLIQHCLDAPDFCNDLWPQNILYYSITYLTKKPTLHKHSVNWKFVYADVCIYLHCVHVVMHEKCTIEYCIMVHLTVWVRRSYPSYLLIYLYTVQNNIPLYNSVSPYCKKL